MKCARFVVVTLALAAFAPAAGSQAPATTPGSPLDGKAWLKTHVAPALSDYGWRTAPVFTWMMGYDFRDRRWKLNEYTNQMIHMGIGGLVNRLFGRPVTLCVAVGIELRQYLGQDQYDLRLADRIRDVAFYLIF